ncbi:MAG: ATP12 family chaperone protein [Allosphingosinicella sp.]
MRRFFREARATEAGAIELDARPVRTPGHAPLVVPTPALAGAIAAEWNAQGETIDPRGMPLTGLANAAIDRIAPDTEGFARGLALYGESDLLCYRAEAPARLVERQAAEWDPILAWARRRYDIDFALVDGIMHRAQPQASVARLAHAVHALSAFELAGLSPLVTVSGSLVLALALAEQAIDRDTGWSAAVLDELWQAELWGEDAEAAAALAGRQRDFEAGCSFLDLLRA